MRTRTLALSVAVGVLAAVGIAGPAFADHNGGAELYEPDTPSSCYAGASLAGTPPIDIFTSTYTLFEKGGRLNLVCHFSVPTFVEAPEGGLGEGKGDWTAPSRPVVSLEAGTCLPPGVVASDEFYPDGSSPVKSQAKIVSYKTSIVMYCSWPLSQLP